MKNEFPYLDMLIFPQGNFPGKTGSDWISNPHMMIYRSNSFVFLWTEVITGACWLISWSSILSFVLENLENSPFWLQDDQHFNKVRTKAENNGWWLRVDLQPNLSNLCQTVIPTLLKVDLFYLKLIKNWNTKKTALYNQHVFSTRKSSAQLFQERVSVQSCLVIFSAAYKPAWLTL